MGDTEIVRCLKRHFDKDAIREIKINTVRNIKDLVYVLEEI